MLCYSGLGDEAHANEHKDRYLRFKADESSQAITGPYRQAHPEDNNERQPIHEHVSVALTRPPRPLVAAQRRSLRRLRQINQAVPTEVRKGLVAPESCRRFE